MEKQSIRLKKLGDAIRVWSEIHKMLFVHVMSKLAEGTELWLTISEKRPTRTEAQHRYYFMYLGMIAEETGEEKEVLHELFKEKFIKPQEKMYHTTGQIVQIYPSTKDLSIKEFMDYIKEIEVETGILSPDTELNGLSFYTKNGII